jgi:hypothetical protein
MRCIEMGGGGRPANSPFFFAPMVLSGAGLAGASRRRWGAPWCEIASGGGFVKF